MDIFDKYIFDEIIELYAKENLSEEDYEEIYHRLLSMEHLKEVQPYLYVMRYLGLGTKKDSSKVLEELKEMKTDENFILQGIYYDLLLCEDEANEEIKEKLYLQEEYGYTDIFLKEKSHVKNPSEKFAKKRNEKKKVEKIFSKYTNAVRNGFISYEKGNLEDAERIFRRILMGNISCAEAYLGMLLFSKGEEQEEYHAKFIRYASDDMKELEVVLVSSEMSEKFLEIYANLHDKECFKKIVELDEKNISRYTMYLAIEKFEDIELVSFLLEHGIKLNSFETTEIEYEEKHGYINVLCTAIKKKQLEIVKLLLENNADVNSIDIGHNQYGEQRYNALSLAIWSAEDAEMVRVLLEYGADIDYVNKGYWSNNGIYFEQDALCIAIRHNQLEIVKLLLENNANVNSIEVIRSRYGEQRYNAVSLAIGHAKEIEMVRILLEYGADINYINRGYYTDTGEYFERTSLFEAIIFNLLDIVKLLLESGINTNDIYIEGKGKYSTLGYCIWNKKNFELVRLLVQYGADVNYVDKWYSDNKYYERNILCLAISYKQTEIIKLLLKYGANISQIQTFTFYEEYGEVECKGSALFYAVMGTELNKMDVGLVDALLESKFVLNETVVFNGKEYLMKKFPLNKFTIDDRILARLQRAGWKGSIFSIW